jgi:recombinational DNA repair protein RecT
MSNAIQLFEQKLTAININSYFNNDVEKVKKFKRTLVDYFSANTELKSLKDYDSVIESAKRIAMNNLTLGGDVDIIVRGGKAKDEMNYKGFHTLLSRANIPARANVVYENDTFDIDLANGTIVHKPNIKGIRGKAVGYYAMIQVSGSWTVDYMSQEELEMWKKTYLKYKSPAWQSSETEMAKKTILKRTAKPYIYSSNNTALISAYEADNATETDDGKVFNTIDVPVDSRSPLQKYIEDDVKSISALQAIADKVKTESEQEAYKAKMIELSQKAEPISDEAPTIDVDSLNIEMPVQEETVNVNTGEVISEAQNKRLYALINKKFENSADKKNDIEDFIEVLKAKYNISSTTEILKTDYNEICKTLE